MEKELLKELNEIRKELEIPMEDFIKIMALAKRHRDKSKIIISDEKLYEIVLETLSSYDYKFEKEDYSPISSMRMLINQERDERHLPDNMLFDFIDDYLDILENKNPKEKSVEKSFERAIRTIG